MRVQNLSDCSPHTRLIKDKNISRYNAVNGEPVAISHLIKGYECDHLKLFQKEANRNNYIDWKDLENKDLNDYCRRYLQQCVPGRTTYEAFGNRNMMNVRYQYTTMEPEFLRNKIIGITCVYQIKEKFIYYLIRALEPNCVYAMSRSPGGNLRSSSFKIINKHCDFEQHDYTRNRKRKIRDGKRVYQYQLIEDNEYKYYKKNGSHMHKRTGQIIADYETIKKYEVEHQELCKRVVMTDWSLVMQHSNLNEYCRKYVDKIAPHRNTADILGNWNFQKLRWRSNGEKHVDIVVVKCIIVTTKTNYYCTKALEPNCVYALLRDGYHLIDPFLIIFKHCNFDHYNMKKEVSKYFEVPNLNLPYENIKAEGLPSTKMLQLFPNN